MEKSDLNPLSDELAPNNEHDGSASDLARRLARYRQRVEAEGRKRSLDILDVAIRDANRGPECIF